MDEEGLTPMHSAAAIGNQKIVGFLILKGAEKDAIENWSSTPLQAAVSKGRRVIVRTLLEARSNFRRRYGLRNLSPLDVAAR